MLIKNIRIKNFRQYKNVFLEFSTDPHKNLTVILGENGYGKTTLIRAFIWCLYRDGKLFKNPILLNDDVATEMSPGSEEKVVVTIDLVHANTNYRITTTEKYRKDVSGAITVSSKAATSMIRESNPILYNQTDVEINKILKQDLKDYFFYDGENNKIEYMSKRKSLKNAVSQMMGIKRLETLKSYFQETGTSGVFGVLNEEYKGSSIDLQPIRDELDSIKAERDSTLKQADDNENQINLLTERRNEKQAIIDANKDVEEDQKKLKLLVNKVEKNQLNVDSLFNEMINKLNGRNNTFLNSLFAKCFEKFNLESLKSESSFGTEKSLSIISEEAIDQLIRRGYCLCGAEITNENEAYKHLIEAKLHMEPHDFGKYLSNFIDTEKNNNIDSMRRLESTKSSVTDFLDLVDAIEIDQEEIDSIKTNIAGRQDIGEYQIEVDRLNMQISQLVGQNDYIYNTAVPNYEKRIKQIQSKLDNAVDKTKDNRLIEMCMDYSRQIYDKLDKKIKKAQDDTRNDLEKEVNEIFTTMYHGERSIIIDKDFNIITKVGDRELDNSTGTDTVKNFAFVAGLLKLIKNNILLNEFESIEDHDECYPLVMDAPFSDTDREHIQNICMTLPKYCDQIFIFVIEKDFEVAKDDMIDRIGEIYHIKKHSEKYATIDKGEN